VPVTEERTKYAMEELYLIDSPLGAVRPPQGRVCHIVKHTRYAYADSEGVRIVAKPNRFI